MAGPRDRYASDARQQENDDARRRVWQLREQERCAVATIEAAIVSAYASTPGTFANTLLQSFVASDPAYDYRHYVPRSFQSWKVARALAWKALAGTLNESRLLDP